MRSVQIGLAFKLLAAFGLLILLSGVIVYVVAARQMASQFDLYVSQGDQLRAQRLAPVLAEYYRQSGGWEGIEVILGGARLREAGEPHMGWGMAPGGFRFGMTGMARMMLPLEHILLADERDQIVYDSEDTLVGWSLNRRHLDIGVPIVVGDEQVGTLVVASARTGASAALAAEFIRGLNRGIVLATITAGIAALLLGFLLVRHITAPLRELKAASQAIAAGDFGRRVAPASNDEVGELATAFNQMAQKLELIGQMRRQMMADIAHELRTPLSVIQGQMEALVDGVFPLTPEQLTPIYDETLLLSRLVGDLRELALAEAGQLRVERREADIAALVRQVAAAVEPVAADQGVELRLEINTEPLIGQVDVDRIRQVLHNLLANALRYTPVGGVITLTVGGAPSGVTLEITDSGPGIPAEDLPYVFDRFYRGDKSRSRASGGSGLGLTISRYIIEAHGGNISAHSPPGNGARFAIELPLAGEGPHPGRASETSGRRG